MAFIPLSTETGAAELYRKILAPGVSPIEIDLLPGDYFVVAVMEDGRFHEVYRRVPAPDEKSDLDNIVQRFRMLEGGIVGLSNVIIPSLDVHREMTRIEGNEPVCFRTSRDRILTSVHCQYPIILRRQPRVDCCRRCRP